MGLPKGKTNNPNGRPKGSKNKASENLRKSVLDLLDENWDTIQRDLKKLEPKDRLGFLEKLLPYTLPKLQSVEVKAEVNTKLESLNLVQLDRLIDHILNDKAK